MANYCGKCGSRLDPQTGLCPQCDSGQSPMDSQQVDPSGNSGQLRILRYFLILIALAGVTLGAIYGLSYCGVIKMPGFLCQHEWQPATCTTPKTCRACGKTEGAPLDHTLGEWTDTIDILHAKQYRERSCTVCGAVVEKDEENLTSFLKDGEFLFTSEQFQERMIAALKDNAPNAAKLDCTEETNIYENDPDSGNLLLYQVTYGGKDIAAFYCFDRADNHINVEGKSDEPVWSVTFCVPCNQDDYYPIAQNMFDAMVAACDPSVTAQDREEFTLRWEEWLSDCAEDDWSSSVQAKNGILYHVVIFTPNTGIPHIYGSAYATTDLSDIDVSYASDGAQTTPAQTPNYSTEKAEHLLIGNWVSKSVIFDIEGDLYQMDVENSIEDHITLNFCDNHSAKMNIEAFSMDEYMDQSLMDFWNGRKIQWDYLCDTGDALYYLMDTPYISMSIPYSYDRQSSTCGLLRVWLSESVSVLFEQR